VVAAWFEVALGTAAVLLASFMFIAAPKYFGRPPPGLPELLIGGWIGLVVGYAWLFRIFFGRLERDAPAWRYRAPPD
jgi:hypothetical protein